MDLDGAKQYFKAYDGHGFHMCREEPQLYEEYRRLHVSDYLEEQWRQEILNEKFMLLAQGRGEPWAVHARIIDVLLASKTQYKENGLRLLATVPGFCRLSKRQKVLALENFAGRNQSFKNGGIFYLCTKAGLIEPCREALRQLMDFECSTDDNLNEAGWGDVPGRFLNAVHSCREALKRFGSRGIFGHRC